MTYLVTTNNTLLWSISLQPILHNYALARYSQYYIAMLSPVTANTTLICPTLLQPILHCYDLSRYPNNTLLWSISLQPILRYYELARYSQYFIAMLSLVTANTTLTWPILLQPILQRYDLSRTTNTKLYWYILLDTTLVTNYEYKADRIITHEHGVRPPLLEDPHRCAYQERLGGRHANLQDYEFCVIILFFPVLPFVLLDIRLSEDP